MKPKIKAAIIHCGYAEDNKISGTPVYHSFGFDSAEELLANLGKTILDSTAKLQFELRACCIAIKQKHPEYNRCPFCGTHLKTPKFTKKENVQILNQFLHGTPDSLEIWDALEEADWFFGSSVITELLEEPIIALVYECGAELLYHCQNGSATNNLSPETHEALLESHMEFLGSEKNQGDVYRQTA